MATVTLTSTAAVVTSTSGRPRVAWIIASTVLAVSATSATPYKLNVLGEIGPIPYFSIP